ncbi:hypothetical protein [Oleiharenicola lentus]|uniref:hypothetical protein n=1 Tax=Oleiharenicola lentus TaxID=2508720 RepID=UPI003F67CC18
MITFAELFCEQHGIPREKFERVVLIRSLPLRIRVIAPLVLLFNRRYFLPEYEFISDVAVMHKPHDFKWALADFRSHSANRTWWRRQLRLRASISRMKKLVESVPTFIAHGVTGDTD